MKQISLNGTWKCRNATSYRGGLYNWPGDQRWIPTYDAPVPGTIQEAMEFMTGDVHFGHNVWNARFIEEQFWLYSRHFTLEETDLVPGHRVRLVFEGLDLNAVIYVNGREIGRHANFYTPCRLDVTDAVHVGDNRLDVQIESGIYANMEKPVNTVFLEQTEKQLRRVYMRKPQSSFEWDWAPRLLNVGIFKPCYLQIAPFFVDEVSVFHDLSEDYSAATLRIRQFLQLTGDRRLRVEARIAETGEGDTFEGLCHSHDSCVPLQFTMRQPRLWQPRGHGDPYRYTLLLTVTDLESGTVVSEDIRRIGLRHVRIDQSPRPEGGRYFRLIINGQRVFAKGGNMVPADILFSRLDRAAYEVLIDRAIEDNFNALRVWGGGIYESDDFYDLCDEKGIVVWQDFIAACGNYPAFDPEFYDNYFREITYQIRRLSVYASLVIYAGNNEIDQFMYCNANLPKYADASLYYVVLPRTLRAEGDNHYYQPSSPWSPDGYMATDDTVGDQHPWSIGFGNRDYFGYRKMECRFPNEGGILGPTSLPNIMAALGEGQQYLHSADFKIHDNSICDRNEFAPEQLLAEKLDIDVPLYGMPIADYVYYGGFLQGEGLTEYILNFRRRMNDTTGSAIFWMYNDCWPAVRSWTTVDYLRNRTPSFHPVRRSFAPVAVDVVHREDGDYDIYGINDTLTEKAAHLLFGAYTADGQQGFRREATVRLPANNSAVIATLTAAEVGEGRIPFAVLEAEGEPIARRRLVETKYSTLGLPKPVIRVNIRDGEATYESDSFVFGVCLDLDGDDAGLSDNFFDLYPGIPYHVRLGSKSGRVLYALDPSYQPPKDDIRS